MPRLLPLLCVVLLAAACSSPTAPTAPAPPPPTPIVVTPPAPTPTPPADQRPALTIACPAAVAGITTTGAPVAATFTTPTATGGVAPASVTCSPASGTLFPVGTTTVTCRATDNAAQTASCTFPVTITAAIPQLSRTKFLAFGDSMTAGEVSIPTSGRLSDGSPVFRLVVIPSASYPTQLTSLLRARYTTQASSIQVTNAGVPGEWAEDGAKRFPALMVTLRPEAVFLLEGYNELGALGQLGVARATAGLDTMAKEARLRNARVFIATLPPPRTTGKNLIPAVLVSSLNDQIRRTAAGEGAVLVDLYAAMSADINRYISADGLHPTEEGYRKMAEIFANAVRANLEIR
ncbi:MAG TPA: GDSL-type esterase/lipase family protein [Vicinamibacterales bacterium]|nr:GDSL-type esterase/lipase family protein [Vicinamibacterales bacterium]